MKINKKQKLIIINLKKKPQIPCYGACLIFVNPILDQTIKLQVSKLKYCY